MNLSEYKHTYKTESVILRSCWYFFSVIFFESKIPFPYRLKATLLKLFGAKIGHDFVIKPNVTIKYPWLLEVGDNVWLGQGVWIDNLSKVVIRNSVCVSQGAMLLTGNHDFTSSKFDLIVKSIVIENGAWVGAKSIVCPGVVIKEGSVLSVGSVVTRNTEAFGIYQGNPAKKIKNRVIK